MYAYLPELHNWSEVGLLKLFPMVCYIPVRQRTGYLLNIKYRFGRCRHSSAAITPVIYEID